MKKIKIIKLSADWCAPCKALQPILKNILSKDEFKDIPFQEIDIDDDIFDYTQKYQVRNIPTILIIDENENLLKRITGLISEDKLIETINEEISEESDEAKADSEQKEK